MKKILLIAMFLASQPSMSQGKKENDRVDFASHVMVTTQQSQGGRIDNSRLFIFDIVFIPGSEKISQICSINTTTINNINCDKNSIGEGKGFWLKNEYEDEEQLGADNFKCNARRLDSSLMELMITTTNPSERTGSTNLTYRVIKEYGYGGAISDFRAILNKNSSITKKIETAEFLPLKGKNLLSGGWENINLSCSRITVPMIPFRMK